MTQQQMRRGASRSGLGRGLMRLARGSVYLPLLLAAALALGGGPRTAAQLPPLPASGSPQSGSSQSGSSQSGSAGELPGISDAQLHSPLTFIAYGDMRFTDPSETSAAFPGPRLALVQKIAEQPADALFLTGDIPWHGGDPKDYEQFAAQTAPWREQHLRVYPVLGNHEFSGCEEDACLAAWWQAFPELAGRRWYALSLGSQVRILGLDSNSSLLPGSAQRIWLEEQLQTLQPAVRFVVLLLHHPLVADEGFVIVRSNERSLARYLEPLARRSAARFIVVSGHVHNYERFERNSVLYLVSGGGGAKPLTVIRQRGDKYREHLSPNFHFLRFTLEGDRLSGEMMRLEDPQDGTPHVWAVRDRFAVAATSP